MVQIFRLTRKHFFKCLGVFVVTLFAGLAVLGSIPYPLLAFGSLLPETVDTGVSTASLFHSDIGADALDVPYIFAEGNLYRKEASGWIQNSVLPTANFYPSVYLDSANTVHIFSHEFGSSNNHRLYHAECSSTLPDGASCPSAEEIVTRPDENASAPEFGYALHNSAIEDTNGNLHLVYGYYYGYWGLFYTQRTGSVWSTPIRVTGIPGQDYMLVDDVALRLDPDGQTLHTAFTNRSDFQVPRGVYYAQRAPAGTWSYEPVFLDPNVPQELGMAMNGATAHVVYPYQRPDGLYDLRLAVRQTAGSWTLETLYAGATGGIQSIDADILNGTLHVIFSHGSGSSDDFRPIYLTKDLPGGTPIDYRIDDPGLNNRALASIAVGSSGIHMAYNHNADLLQYVTVTLACSTTVATLNDSGSGSLRDAIDCANNTAGADTIDFTVAGTINILSQLPDLSDSSGGTVIDGTTAPGFAGTPVAIISGPGTGSNVNGFNLTVADNTIKGLQISGFTYGIDIFGSGAANNTLISNYIGTDGVNAIPNDTGIRITNAPNNIIGGNTSSDRNVISGNSVSGILISGANASLNTVEGNYIGTNSNGTAALPNNQYGIDISGAPNNAIGGSGSGNVISGNGLGGIIVRLVGATNNFVQGNKVGTDSTGSTAIPNNNQGILIGSPANTNTIGGAVAGAGNLISGNNGRGISITNNSNNNVIQGNLVGTDASGTTILGNSTDGLVISGDNNIVGGTTSAARNTFSGNGSDGISLASAANDNVIQGNFIGTDISGAMPLGNNVDGIISNGPNNTIGGTTAGSGNVIASNGVYGIRILGSTGSGHIIQGNFIGTDAGGTLVLGNGDHGIRITEDNNTIGGLGPNDGNVIAHNGGAGVFISASTNNSVLSNSIFDNAVLGIELSGGGFTNDPDDVDIGSNNLQNYPVMTNVNADGVNITIDGTMDSTPNSGFTLQFFTNSACDISGFGEGEALIGTTTVTTDPNGDATFSVTFPSTATPGDNITATATDGNNNSSEFSPCFVTTMSNQPPVANDDSFSTNEDVTLNESAPGVLVNDTDADGDIITPTVTIAPVNGTVTVDNDGSLLYTPDPNFNGTDSFTYELSDGQATSNPATITITVTPVNDAPIALGDSYNTNEDTPLTVSAPGVRTNDSDVEGDALMATIVAGPTNGNLALNADGSFTYTPNANFNGNDSFTYKVNDGQADSGVATVTITVDPVNDAPVAANDSYSTNEDVALTAVAPGVLGNDSDVEGSALSVTLVNDPANGTLTLNADGSFTYTPNANFNGTDSFTYQASDGQSSSTVAIVDLTVNPVNDAPVAEDDSYLTDEDVSLTVPTLGVLANDADIDGDALTALVVSGPANGSVTLNADGSFTYTSNADYNGTDSFTYKVNDGIVDSNVATVTIVIGGVNDAPVAGDDNYTTNEDTLLTVSAPGVLANDNDVDGDPLTLTVVSNPANGTLILNADGSFTYTPGTNFNGTDSFTYQLNDGEVDSNVATVTITVNAVNDAPVAVDDSYITNEDTAINEVAPGVLANDSDADGNAITAILVSGPANGSVTLNADGSFSYTPNANFNGGDSFTYKANDGQADSNVATVNITVTSVNDAPVAVDDAYNTLEDTALTVAAPGVLGNDSDSVEGDPLTAVLVSGPTNGTLTLNADGSFTYTPNLNFSGLDSFVYRANDGADDSNDAMVTITIVSAADKIDDLIAQVDQLVADGALNGGNGTALKAKLNNAKKHLAKGKNSQAIDSMNTFINQVNVFVGNGTLTSAQGQELLDCANAVKVSLNQ